VEVFMSGKRYSKDFNVTGGSDRGWLDQVQFIEGPREEVIFKNGF